jgi:hypothetical protein
MLGMNGIAHEELARIPRADTRRVKSRPDPTTPAGDHAAMGTLLYRKRNVVVSSKQQA